VSSLPDIAREVPAVCLLHIGVLLPSLLCRPITLDNWFSNCAAAVYCCYTDCVKFSVADMKERMQNVFLLKSLVQFWRGECAAGGYVLGVCGHYVVVSRGN
jgi:hypothetical protein